MRLISISLLILLLVTSSAFGADVTGKWKGKIEDPAMDVVFDLKSEGSAVTGTMTGADGKPRSVTKGSLDGDKISMTIASEWQGSPITLIANGAVTEDTIKIVLQTESGEWQTNIILTKG